MTSMLVTALILAVALAMTSFAMPLHAAREAPYASDPCAHFAGGFADASNFTLAALNRTLPNANDTGAPLVLGQAGAIVGAEFEVLSTWASFPFNEWPTVSLVGGGLIGNMEPPGGAVKTVSGGASNGSEITFITTSFFPPSPAQVYCAVASTDPAGHSTGFPALALHGETDLFSLCMTSASPRAQNNVVYNATAANFGAYLFDTCYPVTLQLVGLPK